MWRGWFSFHNAYEVQNGINTGLNQYFYILMGKIVNIYSNNDLHTTVLRLLRTTCFPSGVMVLVMFIGACSDRLSLYPDSDSSPRTELSLRPTAQLQVHPLQVESRFY